MLVIATGHVVGSVKSSRIDANITDWASAVSLIVEDHKVERDWIAQLYFVSSDFLIRTLTNPIYHDDPFPLVEDVTDFAEMEL